MTTSCREKHRSAASASSSATANALGAKTVRACDSCLRRRARWYCAADDAFLCQSCDSSVHSANPLASRHQRVRLKTASSSSLHLPAPDASASLPAWLNGFRRKARTPRGLHSKLGSGSGTNSGSAQQKSSTSTLLVPDLATSDRDHHSNDDDGDGDGAEEEEQLLYRVPIFDPVVAEFCTSSSSSKLAPPPSNDDLEDSKPAPTLPQTNYSADHVITGSFLPSDVDLAEFAADVESLLGRGLDDDGGGFCIEGLDGLLDSGKEETSPPDWCGSFDAGRVKTEEDEEDDPDYPSSISHRDDVDVDNFELSRETLDLNFEHDDSPTSGGEEERVNNGTSTYNMTQKGINKISLRLNYTAVIAAWSSQGSPWTTGDRPHLNPDDDAWWPSDCLGTFSSEAVLRNPSIYGENMGSILGAAQAAGGGDGGREARVSRYREKRRTRLFSKKIRYEVRKLNAEKRPRMKGRFVKRASFAATGFPF